MTSSNSVELPDVNVLLASIISDHRHHGLADAWLVGVTKFATTPPTELGLVRTLMNPALPGCGITAGSAFDSLAELRRTAGHEFWADDFSVERLALWRTNITGHRQMPDLYLLAMARARAGVLVTLDSGIGASLKPADRANLKVLTAPGK